MKRLQILFFCILLVGLIVNPCFSEEGKKPPLNGYEWESWSKTIKFWWLVGFDEGCFQTRMEGDIFLRSFTDVVSLKFPGTVKGAEEVENELENEFLERTLLGRGSFGQIVAGLDDFYKDYRNKSILIREALYIIKLDLMGAPQEFIEQEERLLRLPLFERNKERQSLLAQEEEYKKAFERWSKYLPLSILQ